MKILIIEDDERTRLFIQKGLKEAGFLTEMANNGEDGLWKASSGDFDLIVSDIMMPKLDGISLLKKLRDSNVNTPVLFLSAKSDTEARIAGLEGGADDYLVKPFSFTELLARVNAILRRSTAQVKNNILSIDDLELNLKTKKVTRGGKTINIQPLEFSLLAFLIEHKGSVVSKTMIIEGVWDFNFDPQTNVIESRICRLREKIDRPFNKKLIQTIRGFGYVIDS